MCKAFLFNPIVIGAGSCDSPKQATLLITPPSSKDGSSWLQAHRSRVTGARWHRLISNRKQSIFDTGDSWTGELGQRKQRLAYCGQMVKFLSDASTPPECLDLAGLRLPAIIQLPKHNTSRARCRDTPGSAQMILAAHLRLTNN